MQRHLKAQIPRIAIVDAGLVGSTKPYALTMSGMAAEIVLIDREGAAQRSDTNPNGSHAGTAADLVVELTQPGARPFSARYADGALVF